MPSFIAGDWGTSHLRLYLCRYNIDTNRSTLLSRLEGAGVSEIHRSTTQSFEETFFSLTEEWFENHIIDRVILSGMVGANIGWHPTKYSPCPASAETIARATTEFTARDTKFNIVSGLSCHNPYGGFDVMRGEELQLLGWLLGQSEARSNCGTTQFIGLPGTHNKWVWSDHGKITQFVTSFSGEMFALLREHSVLLSERKKSANINESQFLAGARLSLQEQAPDLLQSVFSTRTKQLEGTLASADAQDYLSGLIIGADIRSALRWSEPQRITDSSMIELIGAPGLCSLYSTVLDSVLQRKCRVHSSDEIVIDGFSAIYQELIS